MGLFSLLNRKTSTKKVAYPALPHPNYGSALQSIALFTLVNSLGYQCRIINYASFVDVPKPTEEDIRKLCLDDEGKPGSGSLLSLEEHKHLENMIIRYRFSQFCQKIFTYDNSLKSLETGGEADFERCRSYDAFICGSDQIWKPQHGWFTKTNYLQFAAKGKRIAYAPSLGTNKIAYKNQGNIPLWRHYLTEMTFLSARDEVSARIIRLTCGKDVTIVLDPAMMLTPEQWRARLPEGRLPIKLQEFVDTGKKYVLAYLLHGYTRYKNAIELYAKKHGYEIAWLTGTDIRLEKGINRTDTDPGGFIRLLDNASAVITDSFHGTCFSILFHKPFLSAFIRSMGREAPIHDIRKYDIVERMGLPERVDDETSLEKLLEKPIDWDAVEARLGEQRKISLDYLSNALKTCTEHVIGKEDIPHDMLLVPQPQQIRTVDRVPLDDPLNCTGCGACLNICPSNAIKMVPNSKGFIEPVVDDSLCIKCGKCLARCPLRKPPALPRQRSPFAYAAWSLDSDIIMTSSTGGIFSVLSKWVLDRQGAVYGWAFNPDFSLTVKRVDTWHELPSLRGSKYVQGDAGLSYREVKKDLVNGKYVLFSGTPCHIAGLYAYLGKDYEKLLTVELICGGLVSPLVFKKWVEMREKEAGARLVDLKFRSKKHGWGELLLLLLFANGKKYEGTLDFDPYGFLYLRKYTVRTSCHRCVYKGADYRPGDFTIGDFWGIGKFAKFSLPKKQGVSAVMTNSVKARLIWQQLRSTRGCIFVVERSMDEMLRGNPILLHRPHKPVTYNILFEKFAQKNFQTAFREMFGPDEIRDTKGQTLPD